MNFHPDHSPFLPSTDKEEIKRGQILKVRGDKAGSRLPSHKAVLHVLVWHGRVLASITATVLSRVHSPHSTQASKMEKFAELGKRKVGLLAGL